MFFFLIYVGVTGVSGVTGVTGVSDVTGVTDSYAVLVEWYVAVSDSA